MPPFHCHRPPRQSRLFPIGLVALFLLLTVACSNSPATPTAAPGDPSASSVPAAQDFTPLTQVAVGQYHTCGLQADGQAVCWGDDNVYALTNAPERERFRQITVGQSFACGLKVDGSLYCWGENLHNKATPPAGQFTALAVGKQHGCALQVDGYARCWGWDRDGRATPPPKVAFTAIAAGGSHSCGLSGSGDLHCWGSNYYEQSSFLKGPFQALALGAHNTCVLRQDGGVVCQGGKSVEQARPPAGAFIQIAAGENHGCGLRADQIIECWGNGLSDGLAAPAGQFTALSAGWSDTCALRADGYPECWSYSSGLPAPVAQPAELSSVPSLSRIIRRPVELIPWPEGGLAVVERDGYITLCNPTPDFLCAQGATPPILDLTDQTDCCNGEKGMLSAALDPDFERFPFLYVYYNVLDDRKNIRLSRFPVVDGYVDRAAELVMLELPMPTLFVHGGAIRFGSDGMLYLGLGINQFHEAAQSVTSLYGKIIRIDARFASPGQPYRIPEDNPFLAIPEARGEIWAYGLRNPWRMSFDTAGRLWVGDVGYDSVEEVSIVSAGANMGWPVFEGDRCFAATPQCATLTDAISPVTTYSHDAGCAIIWGGQYQGAALPQLAGDYLFGDYCSGRIWALSGDAANGWQRRSVGKLKVPIVSFATDAAGEMYVLSVNSPILKLEPALLEPLE